MFENQQSLESYQLSRDRISRIKGKQATMPSWELLVILIQIQIWRILKQKKIKGISGLSRKVDGNFQRFSLNEKVNTIQMGLAAVFNPDTYGQQNKEEFHLYQGHSNHPG